MALHCAVSVFLQAWVLLGLLRKANFFFSCLISSTYINNGSSEGERGGEKGEEGGGRKEATWFPGPNWEPLTSDGGSS